MTPELESVPAIVIGAGVIGCAVAYELALSGRPPWIFEKGPRIAEGTTSRNSGVIHAGIYYPPRSLKAESCIQGSFLLYEWCEKQGVPHRQTGKWIVGQKDDEQTLHEIYENGRFSGAQGLKWATNKEVIQEDCAQIRADLGIFSSLTGIVDPYLYTKSFQIKSQELGAEFCFKTEVIGITQLSSGCFLVETSRGPMKSEVVINAAGLYADEIARLAGIHDYQIYPWRGDYYRITSPRKFSKLIYPVKRKNAPGLGVHLTLGLDGSARLGPDVTVAQSKEDFGQPSEEILQNKTKLFFESASKFLLDLKITDLEYESCGIRPKLRSPQDQEEKDFVLSQDLPGFFNFIGIESPGLTASRDLARRLVAMLK